MGATDVRPENVTGLWSVWRAPRCPTVYALKHEGSEEAMTSRYNQIADRLRQGGVQLRGPDGAVKRKFTAPNLRTRW